MEAEGFMSIAVVITYLWAHEGTSNKGEQGDIAVAYSITFRYFFLALQ